MIKNCLRLVGLVILLRIFIKLDYGKFIECFRGADLTLMSVSLLFLFGFIISKSLRWYEFLKIQKIAYPLRKTVSAYLIGMFFSAITPAKLGDFVKVFYLEKEAEVSHFRALSSVFADRLCDLFALLLVAFLSMFWGIFPKAYTLPCQIFGVCLAGCGLMMFHSPTARVVFATLSKLPVIGGMLAARRPLLEDFYAGFKQFRSPLLIVPVVYTAVAYMFLFLHSHALALGLGIEIYFKETVAFIVIGNVASMLPISVGGLGPREQVMKELFTRVLDRGQLATPALLGTLSAQAISFSLSFYGMFLITAGVMGYIAWLRNPVSLDSISRLARETRAKKKPSKTTDTVPISSNLFRKTPDDSQQFSSSSQASSPVESEPTESRGVNSGLQRRESNR